MKLQAIRQGLSRDHRWLYVLAAAASGAAVVGFFTGTRGAPETAAFTSAALEDEVASRDAQGDSPEATRSGHPIAPTYADMAALRRGPNRTRHEAALAFMRSQHRPLTAPVELDEEAKLVALERRAERRAYNGAPPQIPHPIDQIQTQQCVACHWEGMRVEDRVADPMSHGMHANCTQCHVVSDGPVPGPSLADGPPMDNSFVGLEAPTAGATAWPGAPPVIPHATHMRERCSSCHGVWATGIQSSHPWRQSCTQCHAPSAELDQVPEGMPEGVGAPWLLEVP